jgi:hypothetical protein
MLVLSILAAVLLGGQYAHAGVFYTENSHVKSDSKTTSSCSASTSSSVTHSCKIQRKTDQQTSPDDPSSHAFSNFTKFYTSLKLRSVDIFSV